MKHRICAGALSLALLMLTACGGITAPSETVRSEEQLLSPRDCFAVYDKDGVLSGYMEVDRRTITFYDAEGIRQDEQSYSFDPEEEVYLLDEEESFFVEEKKGSLWLTTYDDGDRYQLTPIAASRIGAMGTPAPTEPPAPTPSPTPARLGAEEVYRKAMESTVDITAIVSNSFYYTGTGFFIDSNGTVVTNYHVIDGTRSGYITTSDGSEYDITSVLGYDAGLDIAVLATEKRGSTPLPRRNNGAVTGETVYALGSSLGLTGTFSNGIVSSALRDIGDGYVYIQHTAAISHGNSGGPLLDKNGSVIGINCAYIEDGQNINLAIPIAEIDEVRRNTNLTLESLYSREYGQIGDTSVHLGLEDWTEDLICIAANENLAAYIQMPESLYEGIEINEEETGLSAYYDGEAFELYLEADAFEGAFLQGEDGVEELMTQLLTEEMENYELTPGQMECSSGYVNDVYWSIYSTTGKDADWELTARLLTCEKNNAVIYVLLETALYYSYAEDSDGARLNELCHDMISSLEVE